MWGMPEGFGELLAKKYAILQQNADANTLSAQAAAGLDKTRAGLLPAESAANIGLTRANTAQVNENTRFIAPIARAGIALSGAQTRNTDANTGLTRANTTTVNDLNRQINVAPGGLLGSNYDQIQTLLGLTPFKL